MLESGWQTSAVAMWATVAEGGGAKAKVGRDAHAVSALESESLAKVRFWTVE